MFVKETTIAYKHLADLLALKRKSQYNITRQCLDVQVLYSNLHLDTVGSDGYKRQPLLY